MKEFRDNKLFPVSKGQVDTVLLNNNLVNLNSLSYNKDPIISPSVMHKFKGRTVEVFVLSSLLKNPWGEYFLKGIATYEAQYFRVTGLHSQGIVQEMLIPCELPNYHYYWDGAGTLVIASKYTENKSVEFFVYVLKFGD
jgi:hypothetical protein